MDKNLILEKGIELLIEVKDALDIVLAQHDDDICRSKYPAQYCRKLVKETLNQILNSLEFNEEDNLEQ